MSVEPVPSEQNQTPEKRKKGGVSELAKGEERLAYILLIPTLIILFVIAFYPLGSVFYNSLTNREFAGAAEPEFVGLENYSNLLSLTVVGLEPEVDEAGEVVRDPETGEIDYPPAVTALPREPRRYRELSQFTLFGNRYVIGATDADFMRAVYDTI
ncbi:MAG: hypothetical protein ACOC9E_02595, partial [Chloroflexota bacterium]